MKAQEERFKTGKISEHIYRIRMEKYESKLAQISEVLPVLESVLKERMEKRKNVLKRLKMIFSRFIKGKSRFVSKEKRRRP